MKKRMGDFKETQVQPKCCHGLVALSSWFALNVILCNMLEDGMQREHIPDGEISVMPDCLISVLILHYLQQ